MSKIGLRLLKYTYIYIYIYIYIHDISVQGLLLLLLQGFRVLGFRVYYYYDYGGHSINTTITNNTQHTTDTHTQ